MEPARGENAGSLTLLLGRLSEVQCRPVLFRIRETQLFDCGETKMAKVKNVEKRIWDTEGFAVTIRFNGRDVRSDFKGMPQYPSYERMAKNDMTVADWKEKRFVPAYAGYDVDVLDGDGSLCQGNTKLGTVRDSYSD